MYKGSYFICSLNEQFRGQKELFEFSNKHWTYYSFDTSLYNETEVYYTYGIVHKLLIPGVDVSNIGIITPYDAQKKKLREKFNDDKFISLQIAIMKVL